MVTKGHVLEREPFFEGDVTPVFRCDFKFMPDRSRYGGGDFKNHPEGGNLVGWTKQAQNSSIAYLQFGHDRIACANPYFRRVVASAVIWAAAEASEA